MLANNEEHFFGPRGRVFGPDVVAGGSGDIPICFVIFVHGFCLVINSKGMF